MPRSRIALYAAIFTLFFLEITLFNRLRIYGARPELLLIATIFFGFYFGKIRGLEVGAVAGILKDIFTISSFGINTFSFILAGLLAGIIKDKVFKESFVMQFFFSFLAVFFVSCIYFLYLSEILKCPAPQDFWLAGIYKALYTGLLGPVLFFGLSKIFKSETA